MVAANAFWGRCPWARVIEMEKNMKSLKVALLGVATSLSLAACNTAEEAEKKPAVTAAEAAAKRDAVDQETAERMIARCMSTPREELPIKLNTTRRLTDEMNQYLTRTNSRCLRNAGGNFFAIYYNHEVIEQLTATLTAAQKTALESRYEVAYPTQEEVRTQLRAFRRN